jgi:hypothetical protein
MRQLADADINNASVPILDGHGQASALPATYITRKLVIGKERRTGESQNTDSYTVRGYQKSQPAKAMGEKMILTFGSGGCQTFHVDLVPL